jgi:hypothetical protein
VSNVPQRGRSSPPRGQEGPVVMAVNLADYGLTAMDDDAWMRRGLLVLRYRAMRRRALRRARGRWAN